MNPHRDLYTELSATQAEPDVAAALLEEVAKLATGPDTDERGEIDSLLHVIIESPILCAQALLTWFGESPQDEAAEALVRRVSVAYLRADGVRRLREVDVRQDSDTWRYLTGCP
ncbi:MAG: hypothetical protein ACREXX_00925 [Gammaproteobacteria bacterium]